MTSPFEIIDPANADETKMQSAVKKLTAIADAIAKVTNSRTRTHCNAFGWPMIVLIDKQDLTTFRLVLTEYDTVVLGAEGVKHQLTYNIDEFLQAAQGLNAASAGRLNNLLNAAK